MAQEKIKFEYENKEVVESSNPDWYWGGIPKPAVVELAPEKAQQISENLAILQANREATLKAQAEKEQEEKYQKLLIEHQQFQEQVKGLITPDFEARYFFSKDRMDYVRRVDVIKNKVDVEVYYEGTVWSGWSRSSTNSPWVLYVDYKRRRYGTLAKALAKAQEIINEKIADNKARAESRDKAETEIQKTAREIEPLGIKVFKDQYKEKVWLGIKKRDEKEYNEVSVLGERATKDGKYFGVNKVKIVGKMSYEAYGKLIKFIESLDVEADYTW